MRTTAVVVVIVIQCGLILELIVTIYIANWLCAIATTTTTTTAIVYGAIVAVIVLAVVVGAAVVVVVWVNNQI